MSTTPATPTSANPKGDSALRSANSKGARVVNYFSLPGHWTTVTASHGLKATLDEFEALEAALYSAYNGGFELEYADDEVYAFALNGDDCDWNSLPRAFLLLLGTLIAKNGLEYLEFGAAAVDDEPWMGIYDGAPGYFRIRSNGSVWEPAITW
jgi:hypothetical protein